jgi:serine---pyruvate transaminase
MLQKKFLFTPGPTPVPERVLLAMAQPMLHHRKPVFKGIIKEAFTELKWLFQTQNDVLILTATGTGGMEGAFQNFFSPGDKIINVNNGKFADRWTKMAKAFGLTVVEIKLDWGKSVTAAQVAEALAANPDAKGVVAVASETSTGAWSDVEAIGKIVAETDAIFIVDAITALGVHDLKVDEFKIDVCVTGSQKALMLPPGLAFASVSEKAWAKAKTATNPRFYFDWQKERKNLLETTTAYTSPVTLVIGLRESLRIMKEEGLSELFNRHTKMADATRAAMVALGLPIFPEVPANSVTTVAPPASLNADKFVKHLDKAYGFILAAGQDHLKDTTFRIAHIGYYTPVDMLQCVAVIEMGLRDFGFEFTPGAGVNAASEILKVGSPMA